MADIDTSSLAAIPIFRNLSPDDISTLAARMTTTLAKAGNTLFLAREPGDCLYVIAAGRVRIWVHDADANDVTLSELGSGDFFGEMAVIDGGPRSANASALEEVRLGCLQRQTLHDFLLAHPPAAIDVLPGIGSRVRQTNQLVAQRVTRNANQLHE